jgi:hypothetical protein
LAKQVGTELFEDLEGDVRYFISLDDQYFASASSSIQMSLAVTQRVSGALEDALPNDVDAQSMAERMISLREMHTARQRGERPEVKFDSEGSGAEDSETEAQP